MVEAAEVARVEPNPYAGAREQPENPIYRHDIGTHRDRGEEASVAKRKGLCRTSFHAGY